jgi:hypothetical protein
MTDDNLIDFRCDTFTHEGKARRVFRHSCGPAVIVMAEFPGISPLVFDFARESQASDAPPSYCTFTAILGVTRAPLRTVLPLRWRMWQARSGRSA